MTGSINSRKISEIVKRPPPIRRGSFFIQVWTKFVNTSFSKIVLRFQSLNFLFKIIPKVLRVFFTKAMPPFILFC